MVSSISGMENNILFFSHTYNTVKSKKSFYGNNLSTPLGLMRIHKIPTRNTSYPSFILDYANFHSDFQEIKCF